jgi:signal transduction histidine kinase
MNFQEISSMNNINTSFPTFMKGDKRKFLKTIEILITNAINESEKYGYIKVQMNFNHNKNLIYFCI